MYLIGLSTKAGKSFNTVRLCQSSRERAGAPARYLYPTEAVGCWRGVPEERRTRRAPKQNPRGRWAFIALVRCGFDARLKFPSSPLASPRQHHEGQHQKQSVPRRPRAPPTRAPRSDHYHQSGGLPIRTTLSGSGGSSPGGCCLMRSSGTSSPVETRKPGFREFLLSAVRE
jgi:hypothetical protein